MGSSVVDRLERAENIQDLSKSPRSDHNIGKARGHCAEIDQFHTKRFGILCKVMEAIVLKK